MGLDIFEDKQICLYLADGRVAVFPQLLPGEEHFNYQETLLLRREKDHYRLWEPETRYSYQFYPSENGYMQYKLGRISNAQGHKILIEYNPQGYLAKITDSAGRELTVTTNEAGRVTQVSLENKTFVQYRYNPEQDLTEIIDAAGQSAHQKYRDHLIIQKTDRNNNSFHWKYDRTTSRARVSETWGDGFVLGGRFYIPRRLQYSRRQPGQRHGISL